MSRHTFTIQWSILWRQQVTELSGLTALNGTSCGQGRPNLSSLKKRPSTRSSTTSHSHSRSAAKTWCGRTSAAWNASSPSSISVQRRTFSPTTTANSAWTEKLIIIGICISWSLAHHPVDAVSRSSARSRKSRESPATLFLNTSAIPIWSRVSSMI